MSESNSELKIEFVSKPLSTKYVGIARSRLHGQKGISDIH